MYKNRRNRQRKRQIKMKPRSWHTQFFKLCGRRLLLQPNEYLQLTKIEAAKIIKVIKHCEDVNYSCFEKLTALHLACWCGCIKTVTKLISAGVNVNIKDKNGWTPLHAAAKHGSIAVSKHLVQHGADANIANDNGILPLHFAVEQSCRLYDLLRSHTNYATVLKYCTVKGSNETTIINKSLLCRALGSNNKNMNPALIESILKSGLPYEVLNCPVITDNADYSEDEHDSNEEDSDSSDKDEDKGNSDDNKEDSDENNSDEGVSKGVSMLNFESKKLYLFSPLCYYLWKKDKTSKINLDVLKLLIDNNVYIASKFKSSDSLFIPSPIKVALHSLCSGTIEKAKILSMLLENKCDIHEKFDYTPAKLIKMSSLTFRFIDTNLALVLLKGSNVVEPEDVLRWIIDNWDSEFKHYSNILDLVHMLLLLSPYVIIPPNIILLLFNHVFLYYFKVKETREKLQEICDQTVRPLASYCRSVVRRQLHDETRDNPRKFKDRLNSLPLPNKIIDYLKFSEIKFTDNERTNETN